VNPLEEQPARRAVLRSALALTARGWHVFPCVPGGKRPALHGNWQDLATADPDRVRTWWARTAYNIGVACGPSGLVVIDLDSPHTGQPPGSPPAETGTDMLAALCGRHGQPYPLPTYAVDTPSGGCHLYYAAPDNRIRNSAGRLGPLIDVRASGGYVIGKDSRIGRHAYTARDERTPVPLPTWVTGLLQDGPPAPAGIPLPVFPGAHGTAYATAALREEARLVATARPGTRNDTLNRAAFSLGQLAATGLLPTLSVATALASAAAQAGLPAEEARRTIRSGMTAGSHRPRNTPARS
jgi:Bifunctional DNA primase/polymerase, N-terminal